jgi:hypothetical protein
MEHRYIATFTEAQETKQIRIIVIDLKHSKIVYDLVCGKELEEATRQMLVTQYGNEIKFIEGEGVSKPPKPDHPNV